MMKKYWIIFLVSLPSIVNNFGSKDVSIGIDPTMEHLWISNEENLIFFEMRWSFLIKKDHFCLEIQRYARFEFQLRSNVGFINK